MASVVAQGEGAFLVISLLRFLITIWLPPLSSTAKRLRAMKTADVPDPRLGSCKPAHLHGLHNWAGCDTTHSNVTGASVIRSTWYAMQDSSVQASHVSPRKTDIEHVQLQSQN